MSKLIRVSDKTYSKLEQIVQNTGHSRSEIIDQAIKNLEKETIFKKANDSYAAIRKNPKLWQEEQEELALWETTLKDGLDEE